MISGPEARLEWRRAAKLMHDYGQTHEEVMFLYKARFHLLQQDWTSAYKEAAKASHSVIERVNKRLAFKKELQEKMQAIIPK
jgi:hypothetical protein